MGAVEMMVVRTREIVHYGRLALMFTFGPQPALHGVVADRLPRSIAKLRVVIVSVDYSSKQSSPQYQQWPHRAAIVRLLGRRKNRTSVYNLAARWPSYFSTASVLSFRHSPSFLSNTAPVSKLRTGTQTSLSLLRTTSS